MLGPPFYESFTNCGVNTLYVLIQFCPLLLLVIPVGQFDVLLREFPLAEEWNVFEFHGWCAL